MHESHQVQRLITECQDTIKKRGIKKVQKVAILVGELLGFDEDSVRLHWEEMTEGTSLEGTDLAIEFVPAKLQCPQCARIFDKKGSQLSCPQCLVMGTPTSAGKEFCIKEVV